MAPDAMLPTMSTVSDGTTTGWNISCKIRRTVQKYLNLLEPIGEVKKCITVWVASNRQFHNFLKIFLMVVESLKISNSLF
jgi:hypothetical protein